MELGHGYLLAVLLGGLWVLTLIWGWWRRTRRRWRIVARSRRAQAGELDAEALLTSEGYRILDRQVSTSWPILRGDERIEVGLRADLLVEREGLYIAEVKTGVEAPALTNAATRRQLLEYRVAYDVDGLLLVDADAGIIDEIVFPELAGRAKEKAGAAQSEAPGWEQEASAD